MEHPFRLLLIEIALILVVARICGWMLKLVGQPRVIGEMVAGILLGPTVLGRMAGGRVMEGLFPATARGSLEMLSQIGVVLFMFLVGLELDLGWVRRQGKAVMMTGAASMAAPFGLGLVLAWWMWRAGVGPGPAVKNELAFVVFMATALSITAFPVLARILVETGLQRTQMGKVALACAALNDVGGWCILAVVLALVNGGGAGGDAGAVWRTAGTTVGLAAVYVGVMVFVVRRLVLRPIVEAFEARGKVTAGELSLIFILLTASSLVSDWIGIHAVFGAFMLGAAMPAGGQRSVASGQKEKTFEGEVRGKMEDVAMLFLLPLFFAFTGLHTDLGLLADGGAWGMAAVITLVATVGKVGGTMAAARMTGIGMRQSAGLGVLMNTRGLMELIILNVGLEVGAIDGKAFSMMVVMTLVTTVMTAPVVRGLARTTTTAT